MSPAWPRGVPSSAVGGIMSPHVSPFPWIAGSNTGPLCSPKWSPTPTPSTASSSTVIRTYGLFALAVWWQIVTGRSCLVGVFVGVMLSVLVVLGVFVGVLVRTGVFVLVGVLVGVLEGVLVLVGVLVDVLVGVLVFVGVDVALQSWAEFAR